MREAVAAYPGQRDARASPGARHSYRNKGSVPVVRYSMLVGCHDNAIHLAPANDR